MNDDTIIYILSWVGGILIGLGFGIRINMRSWAALFDKLISLCESQQEMLKQQQATIAELRDAADDEGEEWKRGNP